MMTLEIGIKLQRLFVSWISAWFLAFHFSSTKTTTRETELMFKNAVFASEDKDGEASRSSPAESNASLFVLNANFHFRIASGGKGGREDLKVVALKTSGLRRSSLMVIALGLLAECLGLVL